VIPLEAAAAFVDATFAQKDAQLSLCERIADKGPFFETGGGRQLRHGRSGYNVVISHASAGKAPKESHRASCLAAAT
jgi:hypothetical protein